MLAGNPFRLDQPQRPDSDRNRHVRVKVFARRFRRIHAQRNRSRCDFGFGDHKLNVEKNDGREGKQRLLQLSIH